MIVTCANCNSGVYEVVGRIFQGKSIEATDFKGINGYPDPVAGQTIICPACHKADGLFQAIMKLEIKPSEGA